MQVALSTAHFEGSHALVGMSHERWMETARMLSAWPTCWRRLLADHVDDGRGRCRACPRHNHLNAAWPCAPRQLAELAADIAAAPAEAERAAA